MTEQENGPRRHVVITGTGRAGTTLLVQILTRLGMDTGYQPENVQLHQPARAGLEWDIRRPDAPYVVKSPRFCDYAREIFRRADIQVDWVIIPMRELGEAAASRRQAQERGIRVLPRHKRFLRFFKWIRVPGGLWHSRFGWRQEGILLRQIYQLNLAISLSSAQVILLNYPLFTRDFTYLFEKLKPCLPRSVGYKTFADACHALVKPDWVRPDTRV